MSEQSFLAKLGLRTGVVGSSASLALAFALADGNYDTAAATSAQRIGFYADRSVNAEKIGLVVMGTEVGSFSKYADLASLALPGAVKIGNYAGAAPAAGMIRWTGTAFEGYNGSSWASFGSGTVTGSGAANRVAYWSGASSVTGDADFTFDPAGNPQTDSQLVLRGGGDKVFTMERRTGASLDYVEIAFKDEFTSSFKTGIYQNTTGASANYGALYSYVNNDDILGWDASTQVLFVNSLSNGSIIVSGGASGHTPPTFVNCGNLVYLGEGTGPITDVWDGVIIGSGNDTYGVGTETATIVGAGNTVRGQNNTILGAYSSIGTVGGAGANGGVVVGYSSIVYDGVGYGISIGTYNEVAHPGSLVFGDNQITTAANQVIIATNTGLTDYVLGKGALSSTPTGVTIRNTDGSGTNITGGSLTLYGGKGTGSSAGGSTEIRAYQGGSSGTAANTAYNLLRMSSAGLLYAPSAATVQAIPTGTVVQIANTSSLTTRLLIDSFGTGISSSFAGRSARGTSGAPTALQSGDEITHLSAWGRGATGYSAASRALISLTAAENWTDSAQGTRVGISTTAAGGTSTTEKVRVWDNGGVSLGGAFAASPGASSLGLVSNSSVILGDQAGGAGTGRFYSYNTATNNANAEYFSVRWSGSILYLFNNYLASGGSRGMVIGRAINNGDATLSGASLSMLAGSTDAFNFNLASSTSTTSFALVRIQGTGGLTASGAVLQYGLSVEPTINQSGTAGYTALLVNVTQTATGSGAKLLADYQVGGTSQCNIANDGTITNIGNHVMSNVQAADATRLDVRGRASFVSFANTSNIAYFGHVGFNGVQFGGTSEGVLLVSASSVTAAAADTFMNFFCASTGSSYLDIGRGIDRSSRLARTTGGWSANAIVGLGRDQNDTTTTNTLFRVANRNPTASLALTGSALYFQIADYDTTTVTETSIVSVNASRQLIVHTTTASTSTTTGAMLVSGGVGTVGRVTAGGGVQAFSNLSTNLSYAVSSVGQVTGAVGSSEVSSALNTPSIQGMTSDSTATVGITANRTRITTSANLVTARTATGVAGWYEKADLSNALGVGGSLALTNYYGGYIANMPALATGVTITNHYGLYIEAPTRGGTLNRAINVVGGESYFGGVVTMAGGTTVSGILTTSSGQNVAVLSVVSAAGTTVLTSSNYAVVVTGATTQTITLPAAATGTVLVIKNRSSGNVTVNRAGGDTIDGGTTLTLTTNQAINLVSNGTDWCIF